MTDPTRPEEPETLNTWGIVEIMGHGRFCGRITEATVAGAPMIRVDIPAADGELPYSKLIAPAALYAITPTTEEVARAAQETRGSAPPISPYELPADMAEALRIGRRILAAQRIEGPPIEPQPQPETPEDGLF